MSAVAKASYFWRSASQGIRHAPFVHLIAVSTIAIALFCAGLARGGSRMLDGLISSMGGEVELTVYLAKDATDAQAKELADALGKRTGGVAAVIPAAVALKRLGAQLGDLGATLEGLPDNPLPTSIEVTIPAEGRDPAALKSLAEKTRGLPIVTGVDYGAEAVERLSAISEALRWGGLVAFAIVVLTTIVIVSATLQLAIYARREEIEIQKLVGATDRFVKIPFLIEGLVQGFFGAAVAVLGLWLFALVVGPRLTTLFSFLVANRSFTLVDARLALELGVVGCALGLSGSFVAVGRFLKV
jgi:cell division transport system permease protein